MLRRPRPCPRTRQRIRRPPLSAPSAAACGAGCCGCASRGAPPSRWSRSRPRPPRLRPPRRRRRRPPFSDVSSRSARGFCSSSGAASCGASIASSSVSSSSSSTMSRSSSSSTTGAGAACIGRTKSSGLRWPTRSISKAPAISSGLGSKLTTMEYSVSSRDSSRRFWFSVYIATSAATLTVRPSARCFCASSSRPRSTRSEVDSTERTMPWPPQWGQGTVDPAITRRAGAGGSFRAGRTG